MYPGSLYQIKVPRVASKQKSHARHEVCVVSVLGLLGDMVQRAEQRIYVKVEGQITSARRTKKKLERAGQGEASGLSGEDQEQAGKEELLIFVEYLLQNNNVDSVNSSCVTSCHGADQDVLLDREGAEVQGEGVTKQRVLGGKKNFGHELTDEKRDQGDNRVANRDGGLVAIKYWFTNEIAAVNTNPTNHMRKVLHGEG